MDDARNLAELLNRDAVVVDSSYKTPGGIQVVIDSHFDVELAEKLIAEFLRARDGAST